MNLPGGIQPRAVGKPTPEGEASMRTLRWSMMVGAVLIALAGRGFTTTDAEQRTRDLKSMTVAELEKAGDDARAQKDYEHAIQYFQEALRKDKKNAGLYNKLGMAELKSGDLRTARANFERAAKVNPKFAEALNNVGAVFFMQKNFGSAAKYFKKAVALDETRATFHVNLGAAWFSQKKVDRAITEYSRALELDPEALERSARTGVTAQITTPEERAKFYYMLAKVQAKLGNTDNCLLCLKRAKESGYHDLANVYKDEEFSRLWNDQRLHEMVPPPVAK